MLAVVFITFIGLVPHTPKANADSFTETATETWNESDCIGSVNGAETSYLGVASGDSVTLNIYNDTSDTLDITISGSGYSNGDMPLAPGETYGNTYTVTNYVEAFATDPSCNAKADDSSFYLEGASGSLTCNTSDGGKVWNLPINFSNVVPTIYMYRGSTYVADLNASNSTIDVTEQFSAESSAATYYLYNGTSSSDRLIGQASCPAYTAAASSGGGGASPTSTVSTSTKSTTPTSGNTTKTTTSAATTSSTKMSTPYPNIHSLTAYNTNNFDPIYIIPIVIFVLLILLYIVSMWTVFNKAGRHGWAAIIPFYNLWVLYEIGGKPGWWTLVGLIPVIGLVAIVVLVMAEIEVAKRFGKSTLFGIFGLFLFWFVGWPLLAFSKDKYTAPSMNELPKTNDSTPTVQ